ncbi:MAG: hypothetical protein WCO52_04455 [bacterium]
MYKTVLAAMGIPWQLRWRALLAIVTTLFVLFIFLKSLEAASDSGGSPEKIRKTVGRNGR